MSISSLKELKARTAAISQQMTTGQLSGKSGGQRQSDDRFWYPKLDEKGNGYGVIRFLPPSKGAELPWVQLHTHNFKVGNQWYIENCPTTVDQECPVCKSNGELWKTELESNKNIARSRKRKTTYFFNVLVVSDPETPANEGKVKIFKCGPTIFKMIEDAAKPAFADEKAVDAFDPWTGSNFKLKIRKVDDQVKYDKSAFDSPSSVGSDEQIEKIWNSQFDLTEFTRADAFKSFTDLESKFRKVIGEASPEARPSRSESAAPRAPQAAEPRQERRAEPAEPSKSDEGDSSIDFFRDLGSS